MLVSWINFGISEAGIWIGLDSGGGWPVSRGSAFWSGTTTARGLEALWWAWAGGGTGATPPPPEGKCRGERGCWVTWLYIGVVGGPWAESKEPGREWGEGWGWWWGKTGWPTEGKWPIDGRLLGSGFGTGTVSSVGPTDGRLTTTSYW